MDSLASFFTQATGTLNAAGDFLTTLADTVPKLVTACAAVAAILPHPPAGGWAARLRRLIDLAAFNFGHAKNQGTGDGR